MRLCVISALITISGITPAISHDFVSEQYIAEAKNLADLQAARDEVLSLPAVSSESKQAAESFVAQTYVWGKPNLSVCFWQIDQPKLLQAIVKQANLWTVGTKIRFDFGKSGIRKCANERSADIRVTVGKLPETYYAVEDRPAIAYDFSEYGNDASKILAKVSMSLIQLPGYFIHLDPNDNSKYYNKQFNFDVAHEFGHALGLMHEHQRMDCTKYLASQDVIMHTYRFTTEDQYKLFIKNIAEIPISDPLLNPKRISSFDVNSIMLYNFPQEIWITRVNNPCARPEDVQYPNKNDIAAINYVYGAPPAAAIAAISPRKPTALDRALTGATASISSRAPRALDEIPAAAASASPPLPTRGGISGGAMQLAQERNNAPPPLTRESAKKVLEDAEAEHTHAAERAQAGSARGGGVGDGGGGGEALQNARAAASIRALLDAMDRVTTPHQR
jgi:hypothetical protein